MDPSQSLVKPKDPFSEDCIYMHKVKYIDVESKFVHYNLYDRSFYKGNHLCSNTVLKTLKNKYVIW
jgi:hypothetical protein